MSEKRKRYRGRLAPTLREYCTKDMRYFRVAWEGRFLIVEFWFTGMTTWILCVPRRVRSAMDDLKSCGRLGPSPIAEVTGPMTKAREVFFHYRPAAVGGNDLVYPCLKSEENSSQSLSSTKSFFSGKFRPTTSSASNLISPAESALPVEWNKEISFFDRAKGMRFITGKIFGLLVGARRAWLLRSWLPCRRSCHGYNRGCPRRIFSVSKTMPVFDELRWSVRTHHCELLR